MSTMTRSTMNHLVSLAAVAVAVALACAPVRGEPVTAPTTAPGESPKATLIAYNAAMRAGDVDGIVALHHATNDNERKVARAIAASEVEVGKLLAAARAKFGDAGAATVGRAIGDVSDADIQAATEQVRGDRAVLQFKQGGAAALVRADGEWKASVAEVLRGAGDAQQAIDRFTRRGSFARGLAQDISAGKVKSADEAAARIERHERGVSEEDPSN